MENKIVRFGELYQIPSSNGLSRPSAVRGIGFKMINMGELFANNIISDIPMERVQMSESEQKKFFVEQGDLLFARQSLVAEGAGKCSIIKLFNEPTTFESHLIRVRLNQKIANPWYYYYLFQLKSNPIKAIINQCAQAGIRGSELARVKVPNPPLPTQQKIASILSAYDNLIQNYKKQIETLQTGTCELYKEWFVRFRFPGWQNAKFENGIPEGWSICRLKDFGKVITGKTPPTEIEEYYGGDIMFVKTPDMHGNMFVQSTSEYLSKLGCEYQKAQYLPENSIMVSCIGTGGITAINAYPANTNQQINSIILADKKYLPWLYFTVSNMKETIEMFGNTGTTMTNLSKGKFEKLKVVKPEYSIIQIFENKVSPLFEQIKNLNKQITNLTQQRDLLLPRLMSGKLEVLK